MSPLEFAILGLYFLTLVILAVFGLPPLHHGVPLLQAPGPARAARCRCPARLPRVTVQLPALQRDVRRGPAARLRVPRSATRKELLEIQVLDDSTDETSAIAAGRGRALPRAGLRHPLHPPRRPHGFKAGALDAGLQAAKGEFVLIFDADFVAPPDILEKTPRATSTTPRSGMVQARWGHINRDYSLLTQVQSMLLDGHFILEHGGRNRSGRFFNFNGTAGIWRRDAIADAGGWQHDTLTEDLDLSYRAQMKGWRFVYLQDVVSPAEIPVEMNAFKSQQHRWAKGSIQTCKKLLPQHPGLRPAPAHQGGGGLPPDRQLRLPADGRCSRS